MSAPFFMAQVKIFPFSGEVYYSGVTYQSAAMLWERLMADANAYAPGNKGPQLGDMAPKSQVFRNNPEVEAWLASGGQIKRPEREAKAQRRAKVNLDDLDDLILSEMAAGQTGETQ